MKELNTMSNDTKQVITLLYVQSIQRLNELNRYIAKEVAKDIVRLQLESPEP